MSSKKRETVSKKVLEEEYVDPQTKKTCLQTGIYDVTKKAAFLGSVLQCLDIEYSHLIPRAGIMFDNDGKKWRMLINPFWFCTMLSKENRMAVLLHEIYHVTHKHPMRAPFLKINEHRRMMMNIAMDMAINQYIPNLPAGCQSCPDKEEMFKGAQCDNPKCPGGCIDVADYFDTDKKGNATPWDLKKPMEYYYSRLIERFTESESENGNHPSEFDSHNWDGNSEEGEMMDATEELVKRAMQKQSLSYDRLPGHVKELLKDIESRRAELNYRGLILSAIKKHASGFNREHSWARKSRRFGNKAPGTRNGNLPRLDNYIDSSGSISVQEANDFLDIVDNFLKVGCRKCDMQLWHTSVYYSEKYNLGQRISKDDWQSGGTDVEPTLRMIKEKEPDLAIILTDGYYSDVDVESWLRPGEHFPQVLWIISRDGYEDHPLKRIGETIKIPNTDSIGDDQDLENL